MVIDVNTTLEAGAAIITAVGGLYGLARKVSLSSKIKRDEYRLAILKQAKEEAERIRQDLDNKISRLEEEMQSQKQSVAKDMVHMRETYNNELKTLGEKIELLRQDLSSQHGALVSLLTKLVDSRN